MSAKFPLHSCTECNSTGCMVCYGKEIELQAREIATLKADLAAAQAELEYGE